MRIRDHAENIPKPLVCIGIDEGQRTTDRYDGFWACMDTFKDKQLLDDMHAAGNVPWQVWKTEPSMAGLKTSSAPIRLAAVKRGS